MRQLSCSCCEVRGVDELVDFPMHGGPGLGRRRLGLPESDLGLFHLERSLPDSQGVAVGLGRRKARFGDGQIRPRLPQIIGKSVV